MGMLTVAMYGINSLISFQQVLSTPLLFMVLGLCEYHMRNLDRDSAAETDKDSGTETGKGSAAGTDKDSDAETGKGSAAEIDRDSAAETGKGSMQGIS